MKIGLIGLRGAGKSTVFSALTGLEPQPGSGAKVHAQLGHVVVPDARVDWCSAQVHPKKTTYASVDFVDIGGPAGGEGRGLDAEVLNHLRAVDALVHVVQAFENPASPFRSGPPAPAADLAELDAELLLTDLLAIEKRLERLAKERNTGSLEYATLTKCRESLEADRPLRIESLTREEVQSIASFTFLTQKPMLVLLNAGEDNAAAPVPDDVQALLQDNGAEAIVLAATLEAEIAQLPPAEQRAFLEDLGVDEPAAARFIRAAYALLDLITFLTVGEKEVRAWPIRRGTTAIEAAGTIHSDIARGFIRAEVVAYDDLAKVGSLAAAKQQGLLRLEGKDYLVQDGDVLHVRFNV